MDDSKVESYFLDCARLSDGVSLTTRKGKDLQTQILEIYGKLNDKKIFLVDDVVFSGTMLKNIISEFQLLGVEVVGIISSICAEKAYCDFNKSLKYGVKCNFLLGKDCIDQICERDFYFGIAGSGVIVKTDKGIYKAPYFKPYGDPCVRASIPSEYEKPFSAGCLKRSIYLWEEIDRLKKLKTKISQLPERIIWADDDGEIVKTLKKELRRL